MENPHNLLSAKEFRKRSIEKKGILNSNNENIHIFKGMEFLTYFTKGEAHRPLILFFPGWGHLGRIAYCGANIPSDIFLAHAIIEKGYSFLAVSYPIQNDVYADLHPQMGLNEWAEAAAEIASKVLLQHNLAGVIPIHWSASGQLVTVFHKATQRKKISHLFSVAIEATPPLILSSELIKTVEIGTNGLVSTQKYFSHWHQQLSAMLGFHIDKEAYEETFLGAFPVSLVGAPYSYVDGDLVEDFKRSIEERFAFDYRDAPFIVSITGNSKEDSYHPLVDRASWTFMNERRIYHSILEPLSLQIKSLSDERWNNLQSSIREFSETMIHSIEGNHFLFIGKERAERVATIIEETENSVARFTKKLSLLA